ncbi:hypothetical protein J3Q64DRAFT_1629187, partial [Phycomyces blakesleeanus]
LVVLGVSVCRIKLFSYVDKFDSNFYKIANTPKLNQKQRTSRLIWAKGHTNWTDE